MEIDLSKYIRKKEFVDDNNNVASSFCDNPLITTNCIKDYFENANIFVTGKYGNGVPLDAELTIGPFHRLDWILG